MLKATFEGWISRSNTNGGVFYCSGQRVVYIDRIRDDAPQDWEMGPKQTPGKYGAYLEHLYYPAMHGEYAFAVAKTREDCAAMVSGFFRRSLSDWQEIVDCEEKASGAVA